jgi:hypothetical protein
MLAIRMGIRTVMTYKQANVELVLVQAQLHVHLLDTRIANVDAVQERHHVDDKEDGVDDEVQLPDQPAFGRGIDGRQLVRGDGAAGGDGGAGFFLHHVGRARGRPLGPLGRAVLLSDGGHVMLVPFCSLLSQRHRG